MIIRLDTGWLSSDTGLNWRRWYPGISRYSHSSSFKSRRSIQNCFLVSALLAEKLAFVKVPWKILYFNLRSPNYAKLQACWSYDHDYYWLQILQNWSITTTLRTTTIPLVNFFNFCSRHMLRSAVIEVVILPTSGKQVWKPPGCNWLTLNDECLCLFCARSRKKRR